MRAASPSSVRAAGKLRWKTAGLMSTWMSWVGTVQPKLPVGISPKRVPTASRASQARKVFSAAGTAAGPKPMPVCRG